MTRVLAALILALWAVAASAQGRAYSNSGASFRAWDQPNNLQAGEVYFASPPTGAQLTTAFGSAYTTAVAAQAAQATFNAAIAAGLAVTSTGAPSLSATYALDGPSQVQLNSIALYAQAFGVFPNGQSTMQYPDASGSQHTFTIAQLENLDKAVAPYVTALSVALSTAQAGGSPSWPTDSATIP